jgi:hypothetical protein
VWVTRSEKPLVILLIVTVIFFMTLVPSAHAQSITLTPSSGPPGTTVTINGSGFNGFDATCMITSVPSGLISSIPAPRMILTSIGVIYSGSFVVASGATGTYTVTVQGNKGDSASGSFTVSGPVGGVVMPANRFALVAPWLVVIGLVGCIGLVGVVVKKHRSR